MSRSTATCAQCHRPLPAVPGVSAEALSEVAGEIGRGNKIMAIKRVRELAGCGLREAKDYVDCPHPVPAGGRPSPAVAPAATTGDSTAACPVCGAGLPSLQAGDAARRDIAAALAGRNTIEAIRRTRGHTGWGLVEARDYVLCPHGV